MNLDTSFTVFYVAPAAAGDALLSVEFVC